MSTKCRIVVIGLGNSVRSIERDCPRSDHLEITESDKNVIVALATHFDRMIFRTLGGSERTQSLCSTNRSHFGENARLQHRAGRYVYLLIRQLLELVQEGSSWRLTYASFARSSTG